MLKFDCEILGKFQNQWALLTAGTMEDHNTMTIGWGGLGTIWGKPAATVYVRPNRHTFGYMNQEDYFTVSFYSEEHRKALGYLGSHSGRDEDKEAAVGFIPVVAEHGVTFRQAECTLICRKIYWQDMDPERMPPETVERFYASEEAHRMYIGEIVEIL